MHREGKQQQTTKNKTKLLLWLSTLVLLVLGFAPWAAGQDIDDTTAPVLTGITPSSTAIDTCTGPVDVDIKIVATDDLAGITHWFVVYSSPSGQTAQQQGNVDATTTLDVTPTYTFAQFSETGTWTASLISITDATGNLFQAFDNDAAQLAPAIEMQANCTADTTAPVLTGITPSSTAIDTCTGPVDVDIKIVATDDLAGITHWFVVYSSPSGQTAQQQGNVDATTTLDVTPTYTFAQFSETGTWTASLISITDATGNLFQAFDNDAAQLAPAIEMQANCTADTTAPVLTGITPSSTAIDTCTGPVDVDIKIVATDDLAGITHWFVVYSSPSGQTAQQQGNVDATTTLDVTPTYTFAQFSETGTWTASLTSITDEAGNLFQAFDDDAAQLAPAIQVNGTDCSVITPTPTPEPPPSMVPATTTLGGQLGFFSVPAISEDGGNPLTHTACAGATVTYEIRDQNTDAVSASGTLAEATAGEYSGTIGALATTGFATVTITVTGCTSGSDPDPTAFSIYIDPSGIVRDQNGDPISGATVTLYRSDTSDGLQVMVPNGSDIMSPENRMNPVVTGADGYYGWDTIAGFYEVRAVVAGCTDPNDPTSNTVSSIADFGILPVPPEQLNIDLIFFCPEPVTPTPITPTPVPPTPTPVPPTPTLVPLSAYGFLGNGIPDMPADSSTPNRSTPATTASGPTPLAATGSSPGAVTGVALMFMGYGLLVMASVWRRQQST